MGIALNRHQFTVEDFLFLYEQGKFKPDARLELIEGEIYEMSPIGSLHARCVDFLNHKLSRLLDPEFILRVQSSVILNDFNQPQPDIAVLKYREDFYKDAHPQPVDILLIIEVADTTIQTDRNVKFPRYASAGVPEAWLLDLSADRVEVHTEPKNKTYGSVKIYQRGDDVISETVPNVKLSADELLG